MTAGCRTILGREAQLRRIDAALAAARAGRGTTLVLRAAAGLGKTTLIAETATRAATGGLRVLSARGRELEQDIPFGVVRQLFEAELAALPADERGAALAGTAELAATALGDVGGQPAPDPLGAIHGLYWLAINLADAHPTLLAVDDAHWADLQSLRALAYLAVRVTSSPLLLVIGARPAGGGAQEAVLDALGDDVAVEALALAALDAGAIAHLAADRLLAAPDDAFVGACADATAGNPFLLENLLGAAARAGLTPQAADVGRLRELGAEEIGSWVERRLAQLGPSAQTVAAAAAVLGTQAHVRHVAALADLAVDEASRAADALLAQDVLRDARPLEFTHPLVRAAIYDGLPSGARSRAHLRAARRLAAEGAPPEQIAAHALACEPTGDPEVIAWLRAAADAALASGAPEAAARYLRRILEEPPDPADVPGVQLRVGQALAAFDLAGAAPHLAEAARSPDPATALLAHRWHAQALGFGGDPAGAVRAGDAACALAVDDPDAHLLMSGTRDFYALGWIGDPDWRARSAALQARAAPLRGDRAGERRVLAVAAFDIARTGSAPAATAIAYAGRVRQALATWLDADDGVETAAGIGESSIIADDPLALERHRRAIAEAQRRGRFVNVAPALAQTAQIHLRRGELHLAEADARAAWEMVRGDSAPATAFWWWVVAQLVEVLTARGMLDEASALIAGTGIDRQPLELLCTVPVAPVPGVALGELALAEGRFAEGIALLRDHGERLEERGWSNPALNPWRLRAAPALASAGDRDGAWALVEPALERARAFGAPWALGAALRAAGTVRQGDDGRALLTEAVTVLEPAGCRLEQAHALLELGASLRRDNQRAQGREHLRVALDLCHRCGAAGLAARAEQELAATGARPRRVLLSGVDALTAAERRVAELAAAGRSNPEIAQTLFVSRKTVETHLGRIYMKLDIASRAALPAALAGPDAT